jgi:hypothetical protein
VGGIRRKGRRMGCTVRVGFPHVIRVGWPSGRERDEEPARDDQYSSSSIVYWV